VLDKVSVSKCVDGRPLTGLLSLVPSGSARGLMYIRAPPSGHDGNEGQRTSLGCPSLPLVICCLSTVNSIYVCFPDNLS
jgi:hypothetical protein